MNAKINTKKISTYKPFLLIIIAILLTLLFMQPNGNAQSESTMTFKQGGTLGVLPFFKGRRSDDPEKTLDCPVCQLVFNLGRVVHDADRILTDYVQRVLRKRYGDRVLALTKVREVYEQLPKNTAQDTLHTLAQRTGHLLKVDYMLAGTVWRYKERAGDPPDYYIPAAVSFEVYLIDVRSGRVVWQEKFDQTQRAMTENILEVGSALEKGLKWLSADELAEYGVRKVFESFRF